MIFSCSNSAPKQPKLNATNCDFCKMTIANEKFIALCITPKNKVFYFDDIACMVRYKSENSMVEGTKYYVADYFHPEKYLDVNSAILIQNDMFKSPMAGNMAAFANHKDAGNIKLNGAISIQLWSDLIK